MVDEDMVYQLQCAKITRRPATVHAFLGVHTHQTGQDRQSSRHTNEEALYRNCLYTTCKYLLGTGKYSIYTQRE